jgi:hypothetical protein
MLEWDGLNVTQRMLKKPVQQGRSERKAEAYAVGTLRS